MSRDEEAEARATLDRVLGEARPRLHRYCARMTGSVIDGEDVVQETVVKAIEALGRSGPITEMERWLFRIAHNASLDFLRRRARQEAVRSDEDPDMIVDPAATIQDRQIAAAGVRTFMQLPVPQRSSVILKDVLGYSLDEVGGILDTSIPAVKAALHRGRARLRVLAEQPDDAAPPVLTAAERARLAAYVDRFNARDFDTLRDMLADDARLDLVGRLQRHGRGEVARYFTNYAKVADWRLVPGLVDRQPAVLVRDLADPHARPVYFVLLRWADKHLAVIRDFRYARYVIEGAEVVTAE